MNETERQQAGPEDGWFVRAAGAVGDLGNPFYREERQRDVWNEASAVGLQVALWLGLAAAAAMVWIGGAAALPYAYAFVVVLGAAGWITILYARALGVEVGSPQRVTRLRFLPLAAVVVVLAIGTWRAASSMAPSNGPLDSLTNGFALGLASGNLIAVAWMLWSGLRARDRAQASPAPPESGSPERV